MRDLGKAGAKAVAICRQRGIPDLLCHYHFLAAVGHKLLDGQYSLLRTQISRSKVRTRWRELLRATRAAAAVRADLPALLLWMLEGAGRKDLPYPFCLPHLDFYRRCKQFPAERDRRLPRPRTRAELRVLRQAAEAVAGLQRLDRQARAAGRLERGWSVFCALRSVLRLSAEELPRGPGPARSAPRGPAANAARLEAISADLQRYQQDLRQQVRKRAAAGWESFRPEQIVLNCLDRYGDGLCGHPVARDEAGRAVAVVDRTNNVIEQFLAIAKQGLRRRLGRAHLGRDLEDQPAQTALAANLRHPDYVQVLCGTLDQLPQAFAGLDSQPFSGPPRLQRKNRDAELRRRNRAWAKDARQCAVLNPGNHLPKRPELQVSN